MKQAHLLSTWKRVGWIFFILFAVAVGACAVTAIWFLSQPKGRVNCDSFGPYGTQEEAQVAYTKALAAFSAGAAWLDGHGGTVGIPCERIYKRAYPKGQNYGE